MKDEWLKNWKWGFDIYPRSCCCGYYSEECECSCDTTIVFEGERPHECTWKEGPKAYLTLLIGPDIGDSEAFRFEITMKDIKQIYADFYVNRYNNCDPGFYPVRRRRLNNHGCKGHLKIFKDCPACQRLIRAEKKEKQEKKFHEEYQSTHGEEAVIKEMIATKKAFEEKYKREQGEHAINA